MHRVSIRSSVSSIGSSLESTLFDRSHSLVKSSTVPPSPHVWCRCRILPRALVFRFFFFSLPFSKCIPMAFRPWSHLHHDHVVHVWESVLVHPTRIGHGAAGVVLVLPPVSSSSLGKGGGFLSSRILGPRSLSIPVFFPSSSLSHPSGFQPTRRREGGKEKEKDRGRGESLPFSLSIRGYGPPHPRGRDGRIDGKGFEPEGKEGLHR